VSREVTGRCHRRGSCRRRHRLLAATDSADHSIVSYPIDVDAPEVCHGGYELKEQKAKGESCTIFPWVLISHNLSSNVLRILTTMTADLDSLSNKALKIAKKSLKKHDADSMKLKTLAKLVAEKLNSDEASHKMVKKWIEKSDTFAVDGKEVMFTKKRNVSPDNTDSEGPTTKKAKVHVNNNSSVPVSRDESSIKEWRTTNKIVVKHAKDDDEGKQESAKINKEPAYFPFVSFDDPACKAAVAESLLRQCTQVNGFSKPSPIQAQAWPILLQTKNGRKRDVVGIAETGSGK
jgi:hypothetical protein